MLLLDQDAVKKSITLREAMDAVAQAYVSLSSGRTQMPRRTSVAVPQYEGVTLYMPGYLRDADELGVKIVSVFPQNAARGLPVVPAVVILTDVTTGRPVALLEGSYLTALRTGASSAVAARHLARQDASVAAVFGAGTQARSQLRALCEVRRIRLAKVFDIRAERAQAYAREMAEELQDSALAVEVAPTPEEAVKDADVVITATTSRRPVFPGRALRPGAHINGIGSFTEEMQEVGEDVLERVAKIVVDSREAALAEAGDLTVPIKKGKLAPEQIHAEIGEIVAGRKAGRENPAEITFFKAVGVAVLDIAVASAAVRNARQRGLGKEFDLGG